MSEDVGPYWEDPSLEQLIEYEEETSGDGPYCQDWCEE